MNVATWLITTYKQGALKIGNYHSLPKLDRSSLSVHVSHWSSRKLAHFWGNGELLMYVEQLLDGVVHKLIYQMTFHSEETREITMPMRWFLVKR